MSIRLRLTLAFALIALISTAGIVYWVSRSLSDIDRMINEANQALAGQVTPDVNQTLAYLKQQLDETIRINATQYYLVGAIVLVIVLGLGFFLAMTITRPLEKMTKAARQVNQGHPEAFQPLEESNELGELSRSIYAHILQTNDRVTAQQKQLEDQAEQVEHRNSHWDAAAQISKELVSVQDAAQVLDLAAQFISERFGYYHVGIYEVDDPGDYAVLRAASTQGGKHLIEIGTKHRLGDADIVGYVARYGKFQTASDTKTDSLSAHNPRLPETRSEAGLPLRIREKVIGVLDLHSVALNAFQKEEIRVLQIIADQLALAIENNRLKTQGDTLLSELEQVYGQQVTGSWERHLRGTPSAYVYNGLGVEQADSPDTAARLTAQLKDTSLVDAEKNMLSVPVTVRGQVIGSIVLGREVGSKGWTSDEVALVHEVLEQIGPALENARLLEETQERALREQAVNVISLQVRRSAGMDAILQNTVRELGRVLGSSRSFIQVGVEPPAEELSS